MLFLSMDSNVVPGINIFVVLSISFSLKKLLAYNCLYGFQLFTLDSLLIPFQPYQIFALVLADLETKHKHVFVCYFLLFC